MKYETGIFYDKTTHRYVAHMGATFSKSYYSYSTAARWLQDKLRLGVTS